MKPIKFTEGDYVTLNHLFAGGDISAASKSELERFAVMLSRPKAFTQFDGPSFPQICETVRTLLLVRMSEEQNVQAKKESRLALIIACMALLASIVQAVASIWPLASPSPTLLHANTPPPIRAASPIPVYSAPSAPTPQKLVTPAPSVK